MGISKLCNHSSELQLDILERIIILLSIMMLPVYCYYHHSDILYALDCDDLAPSLLFFKDNK